MIPTERLGHLDQVALVAHKQAIDVHVLRGLALRIHPDRGLDIGAAWFRGLPLAWIAAAGEGGGSGSDWREAWGGGLLTTCGLDNVGAPSEGFGLHGTYTFLSASEVDVVRSAEEVVCSGTINDPRGLEVRRTIRTRVGEGRVDVEDRTSNEASVELEAPLLYHVNLGWPLWDEGSLLTSDAREVVPRDEHARGQEWSTAPAPSETHEHVWEHAGATRVEVLNAELGVRVTIESSLPRLWQWIDPNPGVYALGVEPANCSVLGRAHDRTEHRLPTLAPGAERTTTLVIRAEEVA